MPNFKWPPIRIYPEWPDNEEQLTLWRTYHSTPAFLFNFHIHTGLNDIEQPQEEITLVDHQASSYDSGMLTYPDYPGQLWDMRHFWYEGESEPNIIEDWSFMTLRKPLPHETPTHRAINDGSAWVCRDLKNEEHWWYSRFGRDHIPLGNTDETIANISIIGNPGELVTHYFDYHPINGSDIAITVVDQKNTMSIQQLIIILCVHHEENRTNNPDIIPEPRFKFHFFQGPPPLINQESPDPVWGTPWTHGLLWEQGGELETHYQQDEKTTVEKETTVEDDL